MAIVEKREGILELVFLGGFSALILALFYSLLGANGLVLGNDPAVHLQTAQYFLTVGRIPLSDIAWYTPFYHLILDTFIAFTGVTNIEQTLTLMKLVTALIDWLLVFSVYLIAAKFFDKRTGVLAAAMLLFCFPLFELNSWGGYTSILSIAFMTLLLMYLALPIKNIGNTLIAFLFAFSLVLSHQLATFLAVFILPPFIVVILVRSRGNFSKALIAAILGGTIAFLIYYVQPILPFLNDFLSIIFFQLKTMLYQVPLVNFNSLMTYFGFVLLFAFSGLAIGFFELRKRKTLGFYFLLTLSFLIPLLFSQSYLFGLLLPYQRFLYFLLPSITILAAVSVSFAIDQVLTTYSNKSTSWMSRNTLRALSLIIVVLLITVMTLRFQTVSAKIGEDIPFYSSTDISAFQSGTWINEHFPEPLISGIVTQKPGHWFTEYSGKNIIAETDPIIDWNVNASCVLDFSYEMVHPLTMVRVYDAKTDISYDYYGQMNMVWKRIAFSPLNSSYLSYRNPDGALLTYSLSSLNRTISMYKGDYPERISITYSGEDFTLVEDIKIQNDTYPITVTWQLSALNKDLAFPSLILSNYLDSTLYFNEAKIPGILDWTNPFDNPTKQEAGNWSFTEFSDNQLSVNDTIDVFAPTNQTAFTLKFIDIPNTGNIGSLADGRIDAVRWQYDFYKISANYTISVSYQTLSFSTTSLTDDLPPHQMDTLFDLKLKPFKVQSRDFASIIWDNHVRFIVYDKTRLDNKVLSSGWVQIAYCNEKYVVLKIKSIHPYPNVFTINTQ